MAAPVRHEAPRVDGGGNHSYALLVVGLALVILSK